MTAEEKTIHDQNQATQATQAAEIAAENAELKARLAMLEQKDHARDVADRVARCKVVAFHADLEAVYTSLVGTDTRVKHYAVKDGKRIESEKLVLDVMDSLVDAINSGSKQLFSVITTTGTEGRAEGPSEDAGRELDTKIRVRVRDGKSKDYAEAMRAVLAADEGLAKRYHERQAAQ